ncbi:MAG: hypothetical protein PHQ89_03360 [Bacilli bacterium]|nr:hypothetical protein [Bacilli bacterium]
MKNKYIIIPVGEIVSLEDEFGNIINIVAEAPLVVIYANGFHKKDWKILIDLKNLEKIDKAVDGRWYVGVCKGTIYAKYCENKNKQRKYLLMHRVITDCPNHLVVDHHPHHYGLDNRECNLTNVTYEYNNSNQIKDKQKRLSYGK